MKVVVVYKKTVLDRKGRNAAFRQLIKSGHKIVNNVRESHEEHSRTLDAVLKFLAKNAVNHQVKLRSHLAHDPGIGLYISIGGDGTFLDTARYSFDQPLLGINSAPVSSVGFFCSVNRSNFAPYLSRILEGRQKLRVRYQRLAMALDGENLAPLILNDILVADRSPAALSRYFIKTGNTEEFQRSSGIWVATPAGSNAALASAGGKVMPRGGKKLQFIVREPYTAGRVWRLIRGEFSGAQTLQITSAMEHGQIFMDGAGLKAPFGMGAVLTCRASEHPLPSY